MFPCELCEIFKKAFLTEYTFLYIFFACFQNHQRSNIREQLLLAAAFTKQQAQLSFVLSL